MHKTIGERNMERYRQYEQEYRDKGDDVKADLVRQAAKVYMNSFIEDFAVSPTTIFPVCSVQDADEITKLGRKMLFDKTMDEILNTK